MRASGPNQWEHVVTHPAVIEAVARWVAEKLPHGSVIICDAPQTDSSFARLREYCGLDAMIERCRRSFPCVDFQLLDLRPEEWQAIDGVTVKREPLPGDPLGSTHVHLDAASEFMNYRGQGRLYGASYDMAETNERHNGSRQEYLFVPNAYGCRRVHQSAEAENSQKSRSHLCA
jgi:hypothetical protein